MPRTAGGHSTVQDTNRRSLWERLRSRRRSRGQSLVEFALVLPVILLLLMIAIDFGRAYLGWVNLEQASREAANFAALNPRGWQGAGDATIQADYAALVANETTRINCAVDSPMPAPTFTSGASLGGDVIVTVNCQFRPITPLVTAIVGSTVQISSRAVFPIRTGGIGRLPTSGGGGGGNPIPVANFSGDQLTGVAPLTVNFTDLSSNAPDGWAWSFGLGEGISASQNPTHTYLTSGSYTVSLTASNGNGYDSEVKFAYITVTEPPPGPTADFTFSPPGGEAPLSVSFTDTSTDNPTTWSWDFDFNGTVNVDSTAQNPSHSYSTEGTYTIRLTVTNSSGSSFVEKTITVDRKICTVPNFAGVKRNDALGLWQSRGFTGAMTFQSGQGNGNYTIKYQSIPGGVVDPQPAGCASTIEVGP